MASQSPQVALTPSLEGGWYTDQSVFDAEQRAIFARRWLCVARASEIPRPGSYLTVTVAGESVIVVRDADHHAAAFYNVCRHRGSRLLREHHGVCGPVIRCPYHAWAYGWDGALRAAPNLPDPQRDNWASLGLHAVAIEERYGCLWLNLAPQPQPFAQDTVRQLLDRMGSDELVARWGLERLATGRQTVYEVAANWKLIVENFSECYHCPSVHPELTSVLPEFKRRRGTLHEIGYGAAYGDGVGGFTVDGRAGLPPLAGLSDTETRRYYGLVLTPNVFLNLVDDHVILHWLQPIAPGVTRVTCVWLFDPDVLAAGYDIEPSVQLFHTTNLQDFTVCEGCQLGAASRVYAQGGYLVPVEQQLQRFHDEVRAAVAADPGA